MAKNTLFFGDNLSVLRDYIEDECVDLIYLDPPFKKQKKYNILYEEPNGSPSEAQTMAYADTWYWDEGSERYFKELVETSPSELAETIQGFRQFLHENDMMAYLVSMAIRLRELERVLKPTGCIYLHCDWSAGHYLKVLMDAVFGSENFRNEVVWHYTGRRMKGTRRYNSKHDVLLFYANSPACKISEYPIEPYSRDEYLRMKKQELHVDENGREWIWGHAGKGKSHHYRIYINDVIAKGRAVDDVWDIPIINTSAKERLGYPTQKPEALLERIIKASSAEGHLVLDPFCGCGTTIAVAERLGRRWIGIDIARLAIDLAKSRLYDSFGKLDYDAVGKSGSLHRF